MRRQREINKGFPPQNDALEIPPKKVTEGQETRDDALEGEERKNLSRLGCMPGNMAAGVLLAMGGKKIGSGEDHLAGNTGYCLEARLHLQM